MFKSSLMVVLVVGTCFAFAAVLRAVEDKSAGEAKGRVFEMRIYTAAPGKLDDLNARFRNHTNRLFEKHGMTVVGYWTPTDGEKASNTLIYILAFPSREAAQKSWKAFQDDPEWKKARDESEQNGKLVAKVESVFMKPTDYSPVK